MPALLWLLTGCSLFPGFHQGASVPAAIDDEIDRPRVLAIRTSAVVVSEGAGVRIDVLARGPDGVPPVVVDVCDSGSDLVALSAGCFLVPGYVRRAFAGTSGTVRAAVYDDERLAGCRDEAEWPLDSDDPSGETHTPPLGCYNYLWVRARVEGEDVGAIASVVVLLTPQVPPSLTPLADMEGSLTAEPAVVHPGDDVRLSFRTVLPPDVVPSGFDSGNPVDVDEPVAVPVDGFHLRWYVPDGVLHKGGYGGLSYLDGAVSANNLWRVPDGLEGDHEIVTVLSIQHPGVDSHDVAWLTTTVQVEP